MKQKIAIRNTELANLKSTNNFESTSPSTRSREIIYSNFKHLPGVRKTSIKSNIGLHTMMKPNAHKAKLGSFVEEEEEEINLKNKRLKLGIKARYFHVFVNDAQKINPGYSQGIRSEFLLNNKWSVTSDLHFNVQEYTIKETQGSIPTESLQRFPGGLEDNQNVESIQARTRYIDFNLGIKYMPNYDPKRFSFFINPSVVWQLFLPQEYQFGLFQESNVHYTDLTYTAYFGSGNLTLGFEKRIAKNMRFQINIWGEHSFIPMGYEQEYLEMFGVGSALLF